MSSANKDRTTVSFHIDKRLHGLLKRCSAIEDLPMSRIIDMVLRPYVEKYQYNTIDEWELAEEIQSLEAQDDHKETFYYEPTEEEKIKYAADQLRNSLEKLDKRKAEGKITEERYEQIKDFYLSEYDQASQGALEAAKREREAKRRKWESACKDFPLE